MTAPDGASRGRRLTAPSAVAVVVVVVALVVLYGVLAGAVRDPVVLGLPGALPADAVACAAAGVVILAYRRRHAAGWILVAAGLALLVQTDAVLLSIVHYRRHADPLPLGAVAVLSGLLWVPMLAAIPPVVARFPDGRVPLRGARLVTWAYGVLALATSAYFYGHAVRDLAGGHVSISSASGDLADVDTPHGALAWCYAIWAVTVLGGLALAIAALVRKFRRSAGDCRQQLRWFIAGSSLAAAAVVPVVTMSALGLPADSLANQLPALGLAVALIALPVTVMIGVLRFRLYELNVVISRSITYGLLAAGITAAYLLVVTVLGVVAGGSNHGLALSIVATLTAAALFQPMRAGAERLAHRVVFGRRATPFEALSAFAEQLRSTQDPDTVLGRVAQVLAEATAAAQTEVWLRFGADNVRVVATWPPDAVPPAATTVSELTAAQPASTATALVSDQGEALGALTLTKRPGERLGDNDHALLHQLAAQAGLVLRNAKLSADLQRRLDELVASRQRLVAAQDEARRHLERDLHDGAQQQLIALNMRLGRLRVHAEQVDEQFAGAVSSLQGDVDGAIENIRSLSRGIYPSVLADKGLLAALQSRCRDAPIPVAVSSPATVGRLPQEVEAAAYFCVMEALQNVFRHSGATRAGVKLRPHDGRLGVDVTDDGCGFLPTQRHTGSGLTNISDRVEALRGRLALHSTPGAGTRIAMEFPVTALPATGAPPSVASTHS